MELLAKDPSIELILMDIMMPVMDGYEAMRLIRKNNQYADVPIIALTAKAMKQDRDICLQAGASDYISKPLQLSQLLSLMHVWLSK
ncbi:Polar-differentiation response regulator DivK [compost metagenome]